MGRRPCRPSRRSSCPRRPSRASERGNTYVLVGPDRAVTRPGLGRRSRDLGAIGWFFYTVFWRWPLVIGDAVLTVVWRGIVRVFGVNGGPRVEDVSARQQEVDYPEDLSPPDRERF